MNCIVFVLFYILSCGSAQEIYETVEAVVGHSAELPCNVTAELEDDKLNIMAWYKNGSTRSFYSRDLRSGGDEAPVATSDRYQLVTGDDGLDKLRIVTVVPSDAGVYHCLADFAASPAHKTYVHLNIIEPPRNLWVIQENGTQVAKTSAGANVSQNIGPYYIGDTVHLFCVALGGKPQASLSWRMDYRLLKDTYTPLSEHRVRSDLMYGPLQREDHGRVLTCQARNNERTSPLTIDVIIDMFLPPELVSLRVEEHEGGRVKAGEVLDLRCRVLGARPPPPVLWRIGDNHLINLQQNILTEESQNMLTSQIQLSIDRDYDESSLTCCVPAYTRGEDTFVCAEKIPLTVFYPPVLEIVTEFDLDEHNTMVVTKGTLVLMTCTFQANPAVKQIIWFHEDDIISEKNYNGGSVQAYLEMTVSEDDAGEYACSATNDEGTTHSEPVRIDVTYPAYCEDESIAEYGLGESDTINITCKVKANPEPTSYRWVLVDDAVNASTMKTHENTRTLETEGNVLFYERPNRTMYSTIFCWGRNEVESRQGLPHTPCTFRVTDQTAPRPLTDCVATTKNTTKQIYVKCKRGHDGGLEQHFKIIVQAVDSDDIYLSITATEPDFVISERKGRKEKDFKFVITAINDKGESKAVEITKDDIVPLWEEAEVLDITTLSLSLCGGVLLVALVACGLVLCTRDDTRSHMPDTHRPPQTEESNCETYGSEDESECIVRRTESFRRAMARYPSANYEVRRTESFHSARLDAEEGARCPATPRHNNCRVHSLQNISRKRDVDCDHLVLHLPPEANYNTPRPMNTFYTMPRKLRHKAAREISDEASEITLTSDGFSLPPPPDEYGTYRAGTRIKDIPLKTTPTYTAIKRNNSMGKELAKQQYTNMSPMNTVGIPTVSGTHNTLYAYSDDDHHQHHQVTTNPFDEDSS